jgi:hypothetical protein
MNKTLAEKFLNLFDGMTLEQLSLPDDIGVLDPFNGSEAKEVKRVVEVFHKRYYSDNAPRHLMLGINPGRLGAGSTGLAFTDTHRCESDLGIPISGFKTYEPSSDFFYRVIRGSGGPERFYSKVYVHSVCPLGFTVRKKSGSDVNINYYDRLELQQAVTPFIIEWLSQLIAAGLRTDVAFCIGTGKNHKYLSKLNDQHNFFDRIIPLEHPRFIMQYRRKTMDTYIEKYIDQVFGSTESEVDL